MNTKNTLSTLVSSTLILGALLLAGCAAAPAGSDDTGSASSPDLNGNPVDRGTFAGANSGFTSCRSDADCPGSCEGDDILCCPVCSAERVCAVTCGGSKHTPQPGHLPSRVLPR